MEGLTRMRNNKKIHSNIDNVKIEPNNGQSIITSSLHNNTKD